MRRLWERNLANSHTLQREPPLINYQTRKTNETSQILGIKRLGSELAVYFLCFLEDRPRIVLQEAESKGLKSKGLMSEQMAYFLSPLQAKYAKYKILNRQNPTLFQKNQNYYTFPRMSFPVPHLCLYVLCAFSWVLIRSLCMQITAETISCLSDQKNGAEQFSLLINHTKILISRIVQSKTAFSLANMANF